MAVLAGTLGLGTAVPALAETPSPYGAPADWCQITDPRLPEVSGLVVGDGAMAVANDGGDQLEVVTLDGTCTVVDQRTAPVDPYDPEDIAVSADGTVWFADVGDNQAQRATVALIALRPDGTTSVNRLTYPDGPHDAEALLLAPDGTPFVVTKEVLGVSGVYRPDAPLIDGGTVPMSQVGTVALTLTGTPGGPVGRAGQLMVTGGAVSADGQFVAVRTYTDAYVWPLAGSDVAAALAGTPTRVPLPESPQGEALSFGANSRDLVVAGEGLPGAVTVLPWTGQLAPAASAVDADGTAVDPLDAGLDSSRLAAGAVAAVFATVLVWAVGRFRRRG